MKYTMPLESAIQRQICDWLFESSYFFWRSNNIPVFGISNDGQRRFRSLPKYTPRGLPDIFVLVQGRIVALEVKRQGAKLRHEQEAFKVHFLENGGEYYVVHNVPEVVKAVSITPAMPA